MDLKKENYPKAVKHSEMLLIISEVIKNDILNNNGGLDKEYSIEEVLSLLHCMNLSYDGLDAIIERCALYSRLECIPDERFDVQVKYFEELFQKMFEKLVAWSPAEFSHLDQTKHSIYPYRDQGVTISDFFDLHYIVNRSEINVTCASRNTHKARGEISNIHMPIKLFKLRVGVSPKTYSLNNIVKFLRGKMFFDVDVYTPEKTIDDQVCCESKTVPYSNFQTFLKKYSFSSGNSPIEKAVWDKICDVPKGAYSFMTEPSAELKYLCDSLGQ